ncbi:MAG: aldo/keto reductase [Micavibrio aeruginosavorus]|uniref:Aldo/keto reductase n=1 Tax=Micavibrio aeruginosavorus TaxID=349221 RepID=A0A7T5UGN8_9BACT|nr:MAG: aldo/keto reductase [Micavibrio aeruginosavorus]
MDHITIANSRVPVLGFGTWKLFGPECIKATELALIAGYRHIDTAQIYENEAEIGMVLRHSGIARDEIFLTTKIWMDNVGRGKFQRSVDESLKRLQTDYVDLLLLHWPVDDVPLRQQLEDLQAVQQACRARLIGVSNYPVALMRAACKDYGITLANNQVEYHPFLSQKPVLDYARAHGMFVTAYSPLARGKVADHPVLQQIARRYGKNEGQIALRWLIQQEGVAAIPKAARADHIRDNIDIFDFALTAEEMNAIMGLARPDGRLINPDWAPQWDKAA